MPTNLFKLGDWFYIVPLALLGFGLGIYGFTTCTDCNAVGIGTPGGPVGFVQAATHTLALIKAGGGFPLDSRHWPLFFAQIIMPALAFVSLFKLTLQTIRRDARILWAQRLSGHTIVCGLGDTGRQIVESFRDDGRQVVVIALNADTPHAAACERRQVAVLEGDAAQYSMLKLAGLKRAHSLIVACGSDGDNLEIAMRARDALGRLQGRMVKILPEMRAAWLYDLVKTQNAGVLGSEEAEFQLFNLNINAARGLLRSQFFLRAVPEAAPQPHLLFAGFGQMGAEILVRAATSNFAVPGSRLSATVLDEKGPASIASAELRCAGVAGIADIELVPCAFNPDDPGWHATVVHAIKQHPPMAVIVAVRLDDIALNTATRFRKILDELGHFATPVFVRIRQQQRLGQFLSELETRASFHGRLRSFGGLHYLSSPAVLLDQSLDVLARAAHQVWLQGNAGAPARLQRSPWEKLPEFHKQSNRALADYIPVRLRCCGLRLEQGRGPLVTLTAAEIEKLAMLEHGRWCTELRAMGWRHADSRDDFLKLHNRLVDWAELPEATKDYNREMARLLPQIVDGAGLSVQRDRIVFAPQDQMPQTQDPGIQIVIVADPKDDKAWAYAQEAGKNGARIWALARDGTSPRLFKRLAADSSQVEAWLSEEEFAFLQRERSSV